MASDEAFLRSLMSKFLTLGARRVRPEIPSKTLRLALQKRVLSPTQGALFIPHYWALYVHDGRVAPVYPVRSAFLIWFRNPADDPRLINGKTPERASQLKRLTRAQFRRASRQASEAFRDGRKSPVIITPVVRKSTPPTPFFSNRGAGGMVGFVKEANREGALRFREFLFSELRTVLGLHSRAPVRLAGNLGISLPFLKDSATIRL